MENQELDALLSKYRYSFHWNATGRTWWLVGQIKGTTSLHRSEPKPAEDIGAAQVAAVKFIQGMAK